MRISTLFISEVEKRLRTGWRLVLHFLLLVLASGLFSLVILPIAKRGSGNSKIVIAQVAGFLGVLTSVYIARRFLDKRSFPSLGLKLSKQSGFDLLFGFLLGGVVMFLLFVLEWLAGWVKEPFFVDWKPEVALSLVVAVFYYVMIGIQEEILARGYWLQNLSEAMNIFWAVILSSLFFAIGHLGNVGINPIAFLSLMGAGALLSYGWLRTGQLWLPIGLHIGWNFFESVFGFPVSGLVEGFHLVNHTIQGPEIIVGGMFGPESGVLSFLIMGVAAFGIHFWTKKRAGG
jgi:hypothetical protein